MARDRKPGQLYGCVRCTRRMPRERFPQAKRLSSVCWGCLHDEALAMDRLRTEREAQRVTKEIDGVLMHRCSADFHEGERWLPWDEDHFYVSRRHPDGSVKLLSWRCKACDSRRQVDYDKAMRRDPQHAEAWRSQRNATQRRWRSQNPAKTAMYQRQWKERLRQDPERYAAYLADQRITYKLRRETKGLPTRTGSSSAMGAWRPGAGNSARLEGLIVEPLALWIAALLAQDNRERAEIAEVMQVAERAIWSVQHREWRYVTVSRADAMVWGYGRPVRIPEGMVEARLSELAAHWRSAPGNGSRLIGYLADAERIAHLAGAVVDRVEDLWPALADGG